MLDSINIGMTGLLGYSKGLKVISNNTANINTPGFKGSSLQFADMFYSDSSLSGGIRGIQVGHGLNTLGTTLSFRQGELRSTGKDLDLAIDGQGLFVLRDAAGKLVYTRDGQFKFDTDGLLTSTTTGRAVMALASAGDVQPVTLAGRNTAAGKPTSTVTLTGNLSSTGTTQAVENIKVIDRAGTEHTLRAVFTSNNDTRVGSWSIELFEKDRSLATAQLNFTDGQPDAATSRISVDLAYPATQGMPLTLDFSNDVTSFASGSLSTLIFGRQDGIPPGALTGVTFDESGTMMLAYSNGQTIADKQLAVARFDTIDALTSLGGNLFAQLDPASWHLGTAGKDAYGVVRSRTVEASNVDLSQEFSDLVVMQRGYQASSQIVTTANEMLQELFTMKGTRG